MGSVYPLERRCSCGADLRWEHREGPGGVRSMALCTGPECGAITAPGDSDAGGGLRRFLVGRAETPRYLSPWCRLFFRASKWGYRWGPHTTSCSTCSNQMTVALDLPAPWGRPADPLRVVLCLHCGRTASIFCNDGDCTETVLGASAWEEPAPAIQDLKRVLEVRAYEAKPRQGPFG